MELMHSRPLTEQIYEFVLTAVCNGEYAEGDRLSQQRIAQSLRVSRQPVLQAFGLLKAQGFLCSAGRRGLKVATLDADFVRDLYEFRGAIDRMTAHKAASVCTAAQAAEGHVVLEQGAAARQSASLIELSIADMAFHQWIYQVANNRTVIRTMNHYWNHIRRVMCAIFRMDNEWLDRVWKEHAAIHAAIATGDVVLAEQLAFDHVETAAEALRHRLEARISEDRHTQLNENIDCVILAQTG